MQFGPFVLLNRIFWYGCTIWYGSLNNWTIWYGSLNNSGVIWVVQVKIFRLFQTLAAIHNVVINICVQVYVWIEVLIFWEKSLRLQLLVYRYLFIFLESIKLFLERPHHFTLPPALNEWSNFSAFGGV